MQQSVKHELFGGAYLIETTPWADDRGLFLETYREDDIGIKFVQGNLSTSRARVIRGLHYQIRNPQGKFMRTLAGATFNAIVDVREGSPTFGRSAHTVLDRPDLALWVPPGFANGFGAMANNTVVYYETSSYYFGGYDRGINPLDPFWASLGRCTSLQARSCPTRTETRRR